MFSISIAFRTSLALLAAFCIFSARGAVQPDARTIIGNSVAANQRDWNAAPKYDYFEQEGIRGHTKTQEVLMILGSPYYKLVKVNGEPLSPEQQKMEQDKLEHAISQRRAESPSDRAKRVADYEKDRKRDHVLMEQLTKAFTFQFVGEGRKNSRDVYVLRGIPVQGYQPPNMEAQVLTGMEGQLWIDKQTFQWVEVTAKVIHPVSIEGFLARVEPGTHFELEKMPVANGIWLPKSFTMKSHSKILFLFGHDKQEEDSYFGYRKADRQLLSGK